MLSDLTGSQFKHCLNHAKCCLVAINVVLHILMIFHAGLCYGCWACCSSLCCGRRRTSLGSMVWMSVLWEGWVYLSWGCTLSYVHSVLRHIIFTSFIYFLLSLVFSHFKFTANFIIITTCHLNFSLHPGM